MIIIDYYIKILIVYKRLFGVTISISYETIKSNSIRNWVLSKTINTICRM